MLKKIILLSGLLVFPLSTYAIIGEDLGLNMYEQIDEGFYELEREQYEFELTAQGRASISEAVTPLLNEIGVDCDISSIEQMEVMLGNRPKSQVATVFEACSANGAPLPNVLIEAVINQIGYIKNTYRERAEQKVLQNFQLSQMGIYSDGSLENSSFDLMYDLEEIDRIIFSEDIKFGNKDVTKNSNNAFEDVAEKITEALDFDPQEDLNRTLIDIGPDSDSSENEFVDVIKQIDTALDIDTGENSSKKSDEQSIGNVPQIIANIQEHQYICAPEDIENGLNNTSLTKIYSDMGNLSRYTTTNFSPSSDEINGPILNSTPPTLSGTQYSPVVDEFDCEGFFCITVGTKSSQYGIQGTNPISLQSILSKVAEHLEKPANASLTQRKMATNNFEISSIITNLPGMLRGFGIQIQSKPVPILELESDLEGEGSPYSTKSMFEEYYKNIGLDYNNQNDVSAFENQAYETKVLQTSGEMPIQYPETRLNELRAYQIAMSENNRVFSESIRKKILQDDTEGFMKQFSELEGFVTSIEDFSVSVGSIIDLMKKIPTRSS